jgi:predicted MFS family arabinose efflux permease
MRRTRECREYHDFLGVRQQDAGGLGNTDVVAALTACVGVFMPEERSPGVLSRQLVLSLYLPTALLALGESLVTPIIPLFTKQFGVGFATASLVFVMMNVGGLVAAFSTGYLMDTIGRRPVLLSAPLLMAIGSLMTPFSGSFTALLGCSTGAVHGGSPRL